MQSEVMEFNHEDSSEPERFTDSQALVTLWNEVKTLREELMLREEYVKILSQELEDTNDRIWKLQLIDNELRDAIKRYAVHDVFYEGVSPCPAVYLRGDPNCVCGLCEFMEVMGL